jgi:hypothetical protein
MTTERQRQANQRNGRLSRGPRTAAGKARSRMNALKHGFSAKVLGVHDNSQRIEELILGISRTTPPDVARELATGEADLRQIRQYQNRLSLIIEATANPSSDIGLIPAGSQEAPSPENKTRRANAADEDSVDADNISPTLDKLVKSQRYERHALARVRRALRRTVEY